MFSSVPTRFLSSHSSCFSGTWIVTVLYTVQLYLFFSLSSDTIAQFFATLETIIHENIATAIFSLSQSSSHHISLAVIIITHLLISKVIP